MEFRGVYDVYNVRHLGLSFHTYVEWVCCYLAWSEAEGWTFLRVCYRWGLDIIEIEEFAFLLDFLDYQLRDPMNIVVVHVSARTELPELSSPISAVQYSK